MLQLLQAAAFSVFQPVADIEERRTVKGKEGNEKLTKIVVMWLSGYLLYIYYLLLLLDSYTELMGYMPHKYQVSSQLYNT